jgi:hypothetical protein
VSIAAYEDGFDTCDATGKRIYIGASKAHVYAQRIQVKNKRNGDRHAVHAFRCEHCDHWHVGHMVSGGKQKGGISPKALRKAVSMEDLAA